ncbi:hypothetical protein V1514DRAFT_62180 [Lipomyces japonicus]|uniref:uncharacterized protein n=1 Tax=Lipomyces japonicus TaxID=56871 RepID=UPI0034CDAFE7
MSLYSTTLLLANPDIYASIRLAYYHVIRQALHSTLSNGSLDILVVQPPEAFREAHHILSQLYTISGEIAKLEHKENVDVKVLLEGVGGFSVAEARNKSWEVVAISKSDSKILPVFIAEQQSSVFAPALPIIILPTGENSTISTMSSVTEDVDDEPAVDLPELSVLGGQLDDEGNLIEDSEGPEGSYEVVAVGGTFDHLHDGHKILLSMCGFLASKSLIIGVTGPSLLQNKKYKEYLQSYDDRSQRVIAFVNYIYPAIYASTHEINDIYGQAVTIDAIDALVVSAETKKGGLAVNLERLKRNMSPLSIWQIGVVNGDAENNWAGKLSSTDLRKQDYLQDEKLKQEKEATEGIRIAKEEEE